MLIDFIVISIVIGLLRRGSFKNLSQIPLKKLELIFLSFVIRYLPVVLKGGLFKMAARYNIIIVFLSYALLLYALYSNWQIKTMRLLTLGVFLNFVVILSNGGKMPVSLPALDIAGLHALKPLLFDPNYLYHSAIGINTRIAFLGDIIPLPPPYPRPRVFSIGDFLMGVGIFLTIQDAMLKKTPSSGKII